MKKIEFKLHSGGRHARQLLIAAMCGVCMTLLPTTMSAQQDITSSFKDANFREAVLQKIGKTAADPILKTDVDAIDSLNVSGKSIANLAGIQHFDALQYLNCRANQLTVLDVSMLEHLSTLICSQNYLTYLNVKGCDMHELDCSDNHLTQLDLSYTQLAQSAATIPVDCSLNFMTETSVINGWNNSLGFVFDPQRTDETLATDITDILSPELLALVYDAPEVNKTHPARIYDIDACKILGLSIRNSNIVDLAGLEYFTGLMRLTIEKNTQLTTIDISRLVSLGSSYCDSNPQLKTINISDMPQFTDYYASCNPQLTTLTISDAPKLSSIICDNNRLTTLTVSDAPELRSIDCNNNRLTTLTISDAQEMRTLICRNNQLTALDVSDWTRLHELDCGKNRLTLLDVSFTQLTTLRCDSNRLASLDFTNTGLVDGTSSTVDCRYNLMTNQSDVVGWQAGKLNWSFYPQIIVTDITSSFTDANFLAAVYQAIGKTAPASINNTDVDLLTTLKVDSLNIADLAGIEYFTSLQSLSCAGNQLTTLNISALANLDTLVCSHNQLTTMSLSGLTNLRVLDCSYNYLTALNISGLVSLEEIYCNNQSAAPSAPTYGSNQPQLKSSLLPYTFSNLPQLKKLACYDNNIQTLSIQGMPNLEWLDCHNSSLTTLLLNQCPKLTWLDCSHNKLTTFDASTITSTTSTVNCSYNYINTSADVTGWQNISTWSFDPQNSPLTLSVNRLNFVSAADSGKVAVAALGNWTVSCPATWITVTPTLNQDSLLVVATANTDDTTRMAVVTVTLDGGAVTQTIDVRQRYPFRLSVSDTTLSFGALGGMDVVVVTSNVDWSVSSSAAWLSVSPVSGTMTDSVYVVAEANPSTTTARSATITISCYDCDSARTITVTQAISTPTLSVSPTQLTFGADGGTKTLSVSSNLDWHASSNVSWLSVSSSMSLVGSGSGNGRINITALPSDSTRIDTVKLYDLGSTLDTTITIIVTQTGQQLVVTHPDTAYNRHGVIEVSLDIPVNEGFTIVFKLRLPASLQLDRNATLLADDLRNNYDLTFTPMSDGSWLFEIKPLTLTTRADNLVRKNVVNIAYTAGVMISDGSYDVTLDSVNLNMESGLSVTQDAIVVPVYISSSGNETIDASSVSYAKGRLSVNTLASERINVYSVSGATVYQAQKENGFTTFDLSNLPQGIYIARGSSGWAIKIVKH